MFLYYTNRIFFRPTPKPTPYRNFLNFYFLKKLTLYDLQILYPWVCVYSGLSPHQDI